MCSLRIQLREHPALPKALPFALYITFLLLEGLVTKSSSASVPFDSRLIYPCKVACVALLLVFFWRHYEEFAKFSLRPQERLRSIAVGIGVFLLWISLDHGWMSFGHSAGYDPRNLSGDIDWSLALPRLLGAVVVVPVMEELFWRSFVLRWIAHPKFIDVSPARVGLRALLISSVLFGAEHTLWLAGIVAGLAYGWLYMKSNNLWAPVLAHATTNGMLGLWVLHTGQWRFW
jgi:CAAX prenyl protease-like protein